MMDINPTAIDAYVQHVVTEFLKRYFHYDASNQSYTPRGQISTQEIKGFVDEMTRG